MQTTSNQMLHPPRLAPIFATSPSAPGTPVHSIQTVRRKAAGHSGPLTKILVANRGVRFVSIVDDATVYSISYP
jgi:pyruvate carboxylase